MICEVCAPPESPPPLPAFTKTMTAMMAANAPISAMRAICIGLASWRADRLGQLLNERGTVDEDEIEKRHAAQHDAERRPEETDQQETDEPEACALSGWGAEASPREHDDADQERDHRDRPG